MKSILVCESCGAWLNHAHADQTQEWRDAVTVGKYTSHAPVYGASMMTSPCGPWVESKSPIFIDQTKRTTPCTKGCRHPLCVALARAP